MEMNAMTFERRPASNLPQLIPLHRLPEIIPSSRPGKKLSLATCYRWAATGRLPTVKVGGSRYVSESDLASLLDPENSSPSRQDPDPSGRAQRAGSELDLLLSKRSRR